MRVKCGLFVGLTTLPPSVSRLSRQCGILNISQPYRPPQPVKRIAFLFLFYIIYAKDRICGPVVRVPDKVPQKLALTSLTNGGRSVGIVRSRTQATEFMVYAKAVLSLVYNVVWLGESKLTCRKNVPPPS
jgi:hypothetical protein